MSTLLKSLWTDQEGQGLTEYVFILSLIALMLIGSLLGFKDKIKDAYTNIQFTPPSS